MRTEPSFSAQNDHDDDFDLDESHEYEQESDLSHREEFVPIGRDSDAMSDYRERYGLSADPFADDPHFPFYTGAQRRAVLDQVLHLCQFSQNLLVVTGDYGVGKTRMAQALIDCLDDADDICFLEAQVTSDTQSLVHAAAEQFEVSSEELPNFFKKSQEDQGLVVIIVDNAHHLDDQTIVNFVAQLSDSEAERLHIVLFAEPHLTPRLEVMDVAGVVLSDFHLERFMLHEAVDYLNFRMEMADYLGPEIFTEAIVEPWWREAQGRLHFLHEQAQERLLATVSNPKAKREYKLPKPAIPMPHVIASSVLLAVLIVGYFYWGSSSSSNSVPSANKVVQPAVSQSVAQSTSAAVAQVPVENPPAEQPAVEAKVGEQTISVPVPAPTPAANPTAAPAAVQTAELASANASTLSSVPLSNRETVGNRETPSNREVGAQVKERVVPLVEASAQANKPVSAPKESIAKAAPVAKPSPAAAAPKEAVTTKEPLIAKEAKVTAAKSATEQTDRQASKVGGLSDQERTLMSWPDSDFTLQLVGVSSEKAATEFIAAQPNKKDLMLFKSRRAGKDWFVIVTGRFSSSAKARLALAELPDAQKKAAPWPRDMKAIHNDIKNR